MSRRLSALSLFAALLLVGCDAVTDVPTANGVASPNTAVSATARFTQAGEVVLRPAGYQVLNGAGKLVGTCLQSGKLQNPAGNITGNPYHPTCVESVTEPVDIAISFEEVATYVLPPSGNVQLNFSPAADATLRAVQYKKSTNLTTGAGLLFDTTGEWTLDLGTIEAAGNGALLGRTITGLMACQVGTWTCTAANGTMSW